jgi:GcvH upstream region-like protein
MLSFFRKYQRIIFIMTSSVVIASFVFFGTYSMTGNSSSDAQETVLTKTIDGSSVTKEKVERMVEFLSSSELDLKVAQNHSINLLNPGILEKDFLESSLGSLLAEKVFPFIEKDLKSSVERIIGFHPYRHPEAPFLSAESVWGQFAPETVQLSHQIAMQASSLSPKTFDLLSKAYLSQQAVPSYFIRKILAYQESQLGEKSKDSSLPYADISLFGLQSAKAWFGKAYLKAAAEVILNGAALAKKKGYSCSTQELRGDLVRQVKQAIDKTGQKVDPSIDFYQVFLLQIRNLGMTEVQCLDLWKDITLFRKMLKESQESIVINPSDFPELQSIDQSQALVEKFSLPSDLEFKDFSSLMRFKVYLDAVAKDRSKESAFALPKEFLSVQEVEKKTPELVQRSYVLEYCEVDLKKASSEIALKETWDWQVEDSGWNLLTKEYQTLFTKQVVGKSARFAILDALDSKTREEVDAFSRRQMLVTNPQRIRSLLDAAQKQTRSIAINLKGNDLPFKGLLEPNVFVSLLEKAPLKGEENIAPASSAVQEKLNAYSDDGEHYYSVCVVSRAEEKKIQSWKEANGSGALRKILDKKLEQAYPEARKKDTMTYMQKDGSWKPLSEVRENVGLFAFSSSLKSIASDYAACYGKEPTSQELSSPEFYVKHWMLHSMKEWRVKAEEAGDLALGEGQWIPVQSKETLQRKDSPVFSLVSLEEGAWSSVVFPSPGKACFFHVLQRLAPAAFTEAELEKVKVPLQKKALKEFACNLLEEMEKKRVLVIEEAL